MKKYAYINPQLFADEGTAAAPAGGGTEAGTAAETGTGAEVQDLQVGDTLADGSQVQDPQVAAAMNKRLKQHPELREAFFGQKTQQQNPAQQQPAPAEPTPEEWAEVKKKYGKFYGEDVKAAVKDRFKNQDDANAKLNAMQPMLEVMMQKAGVKSIEELNNLIMNDDSRFEEEAEERGWTVEQVKEYRAMEAENKRLKRAEESAANKKHIDGLYKQAEALKQMFPDFDLNREMQNEKFFQATKPGGMTVEEAYFAIHGKELVPQLMAYGMKRAQNQMGQTIQAQRARPTEGAMVNKNPAAAEPRIDPSKLSKKEREAYKRLIRMDKFTSFDR